MNKVVEFYVVFLSPGSFFANEFHRVVASDNPRDVVWPEHAYAFNMYRRVDIVDGDELFKGEPVKVGPTYYHPDSKVEALDDVRKNPKATSILIQNMESNRWDHVVWARGGGWPQPFYPDKCEILAKE